jgi:hypothetical protein
MSDEQRLRIDKWLWAGAMDSLATCRPFAGRGALGRPWRCNNCD